MRRIFLAAMFMAALMGALSCGFSTTAFAAITPAPLFTDNAVLQRGQAIPVWGTAEPNETVTVSFNGQTARATAGDSGDWMLQLPSQTAGGPYTLTMSGSKSPAVTLQNVLVGEVWLCSGQSNMEYPLNGMSPDAITKATIPTVNDPMLRFVIVARTLAPTPQTRVGAQWKEANPGAVAPLSAVAYYFARDLRRALNVPVGIVQSAFGGTFAQSWLSREALAAQPSLAYYLDEEAAYATTTYPKLLSEYEARLPEFQKKYEADKAAYDAAAQAGNTPSFRPFLPRPPQTPDKWQAAPTRLFNGMIAPLIPYAMRGAIWYQGEGNWNKGYEYHTLLPALITDWRAQWKQGDFPFYIVQLPPHQAINPEPERSWLAEVREAQRLTAQRLPNTAIIVTSDVGDIKDIHPYRKEPVGQRLALAARAGAYGEKIEWSGPVFDGIVPERDQIRVKFTHADGLRGARITDHADNGMVVAPAGQVTGFTIAGADGKFFNATAVIDGTTVVLSAPEVPAPTMVRYGWAQYPLANLQNSAGLWASPFRTDDMRLISAPRDATLQPGVPAPAPAPTVTAPTPAASPTAPAPTSRPAVAVSDGAGVHLVYNGDFAAPLLRTWSVIGRTGIEPRIIPVQIEGEANLTRAMQLKLTAAAGANPWDVVLKAPASPFAIESDNMIGMQFWARSDQPAKLNAIYQQGAPGFEKIIREVVDVPTRWRKFVFFAPTGVALDEGKSNFELQLGQTTGTFEVTGIRVANLGVVDLAEAEKRFATLVATPVRATSSTPDTSAAPATVLPAAPIVLKPRKAPPYIVLKLDDVVMAGNGVVHPRWQKLVDFIKQRQIKAGLGIITNSLEGEKPKYFNWLKEQHATGLIEFWDHGYTHKEWEENGQKLWEFKGSSYEEQKDHFMRSQALAREKLGFTLPAFGAPFNVTDENTAKAIAEIPELKIWMYGDAKTPAGKIVLERPPWLGIENPIFVPSLEKFIRPYNNQADRESFVIQGHPAMWDDARFAEFVKLIDFLTEQKAVFVTPSELVQIKNLKP